MQDSTDAIIFAFVLALVSLYMILASLFNSFVQPLIVMVTAPLSFIGAFSMLYFFNQPLNIFVQIALIALMGLVMKNGILLVDLANQFREAGKASRDAVLSAGPQRLRPVLMTALSTVLGMVPVALANSDGLNPWIQSVFLSSVVCLRRQFHASGFTSRLCDRGRCRTIANKI